MTAEPDAIHGVPDQVTGRELTRTAVRSKARLVVGSTVLFSVYQAGEALVPVMVGRIVDLAADGSGYTSLAIGIGVLGLVFLFSSLGWRYGQRMSQRAALEAGHDVRMRIAARVLDPRGGADAGRLPGSLANLANGDARRLSLVNHALPNIVSAGAAVLVGGVAVLVVSVPLGLLVLLGTPPLLWLVNRLGAPLERRSAAQQAEVANASGVAADLVSGVRVLKGLGAEPAAVGRYRRTSRRSMDAAVSAGRAHSWYRGAILAANGLFLALVALVGAVLAVQGRITVGGLVAAVGLAQFLVGPLQMFGTMYTLVAQARASAARLAEVLSSPTAVGDGLPVVAGRVRGDLHLDDVHHGHLHGLSLRVDAGACVGVVTDHPAEAGALVDLLARHTDPESGRVLLDGVDVTGLEPAGVRAAMLVAAHDTELFHGSVADNVAAGRDAPTGAAMAAARADQVCDVLPSGSATLVGHRGRSLSGGQRQRLALARALARDAPVLVLHEPTTAVDTVTESEIADGVRDLRGGRTTVLITSSPALLAATEHVVVVRDGRVAVRGRHHELMDSDDAYRALVTA